MIQSFSILIVEDEPIIALDLADLLTSYQYHVVDTVDNGDSAIAVFKQHHIDLVLIDVNINGEIDGIDTAHKLQEIRPTPIIFITAQTDSQTLNRAKQTLPAAYLAKPYDERNLQLAIELAIHNFSTSKLKKAPLSPIEKTGDDLILRTDNDIFIKQQYRFIKFKPEDLLYLHADGIYTDLITQQHKYTLRLPLQQIIERLNLPELVRVHRSYAVYTKHIESFSNHSLEIAGHTIPIGVSYRDQFWKIFQAN